MKLDIACIVQTTDVVLSVLLRHNQSGLYNIKMYV